MTKETYQNALNAALKDLAELMSQREELDTKREELDNNIFQLREGLFGLAVLCGTDTNQLAKDYPELFPDLISPDVGLTDAIRKAMASKQNFISPVEVKNRLTTMGFDVTKHKNILASIHTVLKRLLVSEEVEAGSRDEKVVYRWKERGGTKWIVQDAGGRPPVPPPVTPDTSTVPRRVTAVPVPPPKPEQTSTVPTRRVAPPTVPKREDLRRRLAEYTAEKKEE